MSRKPQPNYGAMESTTEVQFSENPIDEFNQLSDNIVTNIYTINSSWKMLDKSLKQIGTPKDCRGLRNQIHVTQLSTNQIITETSSAVKKLNRIVRKGEKWQKMQSERITENFKEAVANYSSLQKLMAERMKANLLMSPVELEEMDKEDPNVQKQAQLSRELSFETDMLLEREVTIKKIEADILDVNEIMRELGALVHHQGEAIDTIEQNIEYAAGSVEEGTSELQKAARYQRGYRKKLFYLALIGTIILIVLIIVIVVELKR